MTAQAIRLQMLASQSIQASTSAYLMLGSSKNGRQWNRLCTVHHTVMMSWCRHHRYIFEAAERRGPGEKEKSKRVIARLQELGPRFTLKLLSLQRGTFDSTGGEYEWVHNHKSMDTSRRRFFL